MQTLGITDRQQEPDNSFRRIFWPSNHAADVDALGQQDFWGCLAAAILSLVQLAFQGHWIVGLAFGLFYFLGGIGVKEHSRAAAIIVATFFLFNLVGSAVILGMPPGFIPLGILCLLLANIRGTWIASRWQKVGDAFPDRMQETWLGSAPPTTASPHVPSARVRVIRIPAACAVPDSGALISPANPVVHRLHSSCQSLSGTITCEPSATPGDCE